MATPVEKPLPNAERLGFKLMAPDDPRRLKPGQSVLIKVAQPRPPTE